MAEQPKPTSAVDSRPSPPPPPPPPATTTANPSLRSSAVDSPEWRNGPRYPNPPDAVNPEPATLREQWRFATRQYARWYSHAWGTAILAGVSFFALGWLIKGSNPLPSRSTGSEDHRPPPPDSTAAATE